MATWLIWLTTIAYFWTCGDLLLERRYGFSLMYFGYGIANFGILWALKDV